MDWTLPYFDDPILGPVLLRFPAFFFYRSNVCRLIKKKYFSRYSNIYRYANNFLNIFQIYLSVLRLQICVPSCHRCEHNWASAVVSRLGGHFVIQRSWFSGTAYAFAKYIFKIQNCISFAFQFHMCCTLVPVHCCQIFKSSPLGYLTAFLAVCIWLDTAPNFKYRRQAFIGLHIFALPAPKSLLLVGWGLESLFRCALVLVDQLAFLLCLCLTLLQQGIMLSVVLLF